MARDPICGMEVDPGMAKFSSVHNGQTIHFCSAGCKRSFDKNPAKWMK